MTLGQGTSAARLIWLLRDSEIRESHRYGDPRVQDAYSLRCSPQVHGATKDAVAYCRRVIETEMNSSTGNPLMFADSGEFLLGGNFHGQPVALAMDFLGMAVAELANISERRIERLVNPKLSGLPAFLVSDGGLNSGFMIAQYTAAALVSENKVLAHPASVDSIPTSAGKEDHVSMGPTAAWKAARVVANTSRVLAVELALQAQQDAVTQHRQGHGLEIVDVHVRASGHHRAHARRIHGRGRASRVRASRVCFPEKQRFVLPSYLIPPLP